MTPRLTMGVMLVAAAAGTVTAYTGQAPSQPPRFQASTQLVEVDVRVVDGAGWFVTDLVQDDFTVVERGASQPVRGLYFVGGDAGTPSAAPLVSWRGAPTDRAAGAPATIASQTWVFAFDLQHLSAGGGFDRARSAVRSFLRERFRQGDLGGILAGSTMVGNRLSNVRSELESAVDAVKPVGEHRTRQQELTREFPRIRDESEALAIADGNSDALQRAIARACGEDPVLCRNADPMLREKAQRFRTLMQRGALDTLNALTALANGLARIPGPKTVVLLSEGFVTQELDGALRKAVGQAARAGARVYAIDVRGLNRGASADIGDRPIADDPSGGPARFDLSLDGPNSLAVDTGGFFVQHENNIERALARVADEANQYYVLTYEPQGLTLDGAYHTIEVRVRRPDVKVRARRGYLALPASALLMPQPIRR